jgi:uncharacterized membrane protein
LDDFTQFVPMSEPGRTVRFNAFDSALGISAALRVVFAAGLLILLWSAVGWALR